MADERKSKAEIDLRLTEEEQDRFFAFVEKHTLEQAVDELEMEYGLQLSTAAIGTWAGKRRKAAANLQFHALLSDIKHDAELAEDFGTQVSAAQIEGLTQANVAMLTQSVFRAQREKDPANVAFSVGLLTQLLQAVAKQRTGEANVISAEVSRDRFQFDAAKAIDAKLETLVALKRDVTDQRTRFERIIETVFGRRPANLSSQTFAGGESEGSPASSDLTNKGSNVSDMESDAARSGSLANILDKEAGDV